MRSRTQTTVAGRVRAIRVQPWAGNPALELNLADETGSITVVFLGRREIGGVRLGTIMQVTGVSGEHHRIRAIMNPEYRLISSPAEPTSDRNPDDTTMVGNTNGTATPSHTSRRPGYR